MAIFKGLQVELVEVVEHTDEASARPCKEYRSIFCDEKTKGLTCRQLVRLRPGHTFTIKIGVLHDFDWADSDGLCLKIDFDACNEVNGAQIFCVRHNNTQFESALPMTRSSTGSPLTASISRLTQLVTPHEELEVCFKTVLLSNESARARDRVGRHGEVWIAVDRCELENRDNQLRLLKEKQNASRPTLQKLRAAGVHSRIECFDAKRRPATGLNFKATNGHPVGQFVFSYRTPDQFEHIKNEEETDKSEDTPEVVNSPLFEPESPLGTSRIKYRRSSSLESIEAFTIIVSSPDQSHDKETQSSRASMAPAELTVEHVLRMQADYEAKTAALHRDHTTLETHYASEDSKWRKKIAQLNAKSQKQNADNERAIKSLREEYDTLQANIARQQRDFEAEEEVLNEKIQNSKRVSEAFAACATKRAKLSHAE